jgi:hypothetical protein
VQYIMRQISLEIPLGPFTLFAEDAPEIDVDGMPSAPVFVDGEIVGRAPIIHAEAVGRSKLRVAIDLPDELAELVGEPGDESCISGRALALPERAARPLALVR